MIYLENIDLVKAITATFSVLITVAITLKITVRIDINKILSELHQHYLTKRYNKKANDYNRLFSYFHPSLIQSPSGQLIEFIYKQNNTTLFYPDYEKKKIFILKDDEKRKKKANKIYLTELNNSQFSNSHAITLNEKVKLSKSDFYCHKALSKDFKYFLELSELIEKNYTFQKIVQAKWSAESVMNLKLLKQNEIIKNI
jgi:hypothetical protein